MQSQAAEKPDFRSPSAVSTQILNNRQSSKALQIKNIRHHLDLHATFEYIACMNGRQYTIRAIPLSVDQALRRRAFEESKSLNAVAVEALARGLDLDAKPIEYDDLDALIGTWQEDPGFDQAIADFERIDEEAWK